MNKEAIEKYLELNAAPQKLKDYLLGAETEDDFDFEKSLKEHQEERVNFFHEKFAPSIIEKHDEDTKEGRYLDTINPIRRKLIKVGGFTADDVKDKSPKELIDLLQSKFETKVSTAAKSTNEELQSKIEEYQNKYLETHTQYEDLKNNFEVSLNTAKAEMAKEKNEYIINDKFSRLINSGKVDFSIPTNTASDILKLRINAYGYKLELNAKGELEVKSKDGGVPIDFSGNNKFEDPLRLIQEVAAKDGLLKNSNGGEQKRVKPNEFIANGAKVSSDSTNWLAQQLSA